ncbi:MAG: amidohydrolase family protein [Gemmatimonadota bacterium]
MRRYPWLAGTWIMLLFVAVQIRAQTPVGAGGTTTAFVDVSVVPMMEEVVVGGQTVLVRDGTIAAIGPSADITVPEDATVIDGTGRFLIPGLSDMHAHVSDREGNRPQDYLAQGITVVRNMMGNERHLAGREQVRTGRLPGPHFTTAGAAISGARLGSLHRVPADAEEARRLVRDQAAAGYDYVKVYSLLSREIYVATLDEAAKVGIPVVGHLTDEVPLEMALELGQTSFEHMYGYFWALESDASELRGEWDPRRLFHAVEIDEHKLADVARMTASAGAWNCPTLWRKSNFLTSPLAEDAWNDPELRSLGESNRATLLVALFNANARLLTGTDDRAEIIHEELRLFVEAGLSPYAALRASTVAAAEYLGALDRFGTIEVGKEANLVLLEGDPLSDIGNTSRQVGTMMRGLWIPRR